MRLIFSEQFDSVTPPAIPSTVMAKLNSGDVVATTSSFFLSSPNSISATNPGNLSLATVYSNKPDGSNGNCTFTASYMVGAGADSNLGPRLGVGGQWVRGAANDNSYEVQVVRAAGIVAFYRNNGGAQTNLFLSNGNAGLFVVSVWYTMQLSRAGNSFSLSVQRQTDSNWLVGSGNNLAWQSGSGLTFSVTDGSPLPSVPSYAGMFLVASTGASVYADNLVVYDQTSSLRRRRR